MKFDGRINKSEISGSSNLKHTPLMEQQFVVTHTIRKTEISALLEICVTNKPSVNILHPQKKMLLIFS